MISKRIKIVLRPVSVPARRVIKYDKIRDILGYVRGVNSAYKAFPGGLLKASNSTGGFLERIIQLSIEANSQGDWLLVSEPETVPLEISGAWLNKYGKKLPRIDTFESLIGTTWSSQEHNYDLCIYPLPNLQKQYGVIMHQSLLEHVVDPVSVIKNLNNLLIPGGVQVIQTVNIYASEHKFPIDTLRFFPDFFSNLPKYLDLNCDKVFVENQSIYAVLRKTSNSE